jgi:eukaryotic-like serine/threonine-protein kinase
VESRRWEEIVELCGQALELPASEREAFLRGRCGADLSLHRELGSLLSFAGKPGFLDSSVVADHFQPAAIVAGRFRISRLLGRGGMGEVYEAEDLQLGGHVALKTVRPDLLYDPQSIELFKREIQLAKRVTHPNVCRIYDLGFHPSASHPDARIFLTMELLDGQTLSKRLSAGPLSPSEAFPLIHQIADALGAAHNAGIVHRDFKSGNVMLVPDESGIRAVVMDFGLARTAADDVSSSTTQTLAVVGTPDYMAPEQLTGGLITPAADIYALGIVMYEMVTGQRPFSGDTPFDVAVRRLHQAPPSPRQLKPDLDPCWEKTILRCLSRQPEERFQSTGEIILALSGQGGVARRKRRAWVAAAAAIVIAGTATAYLLVRGARPKLTEKDTIVLADFTNTTGDPVFDDALRQGLSAQLEQSPFVSLVSGQRIAQTLALMSRPKDSRLTKDLAREVCLRTSSAADIEGSIASLGTQYVLGLNAFDCRTGDQLAQEQVTANRKEQVLNALGDAATRLRRKLGESLASIQKYDAPIYSVTTPSLEALKAYSLGYQTGYVKGDSATAIPFFQRAVSLDPNFAAAYARMGTAFVNIGEGARAAENMRKGYELRGRTSQQENYYITSHYHSVATGNFEAALTAYELWAQTYPRDDTAQPNLTSTYNSLGQYEKGLTSAREALRLNPGSGLIWGNLVWQYELLNRLDEAKAAAQQARAHSLDGPQVHLSLYQVDFLEHDTAAMQREAAALMQEAAYEDIMLYNESLTAADTGEFVKARELTRQAVASALRTNKDGTAAVYEADAAIREAVAGNLVLAKQEARAAFALANDKHAEGISAIVFGLTGDSAQALRLAGDLAKRFPEDTYARFEYLPMIHAAIALRTGDSAKAVQALAAAAPYELGNGVGGGHAHLCAVYLRGDAYLAARQGDAAAVEFQKILDHPGVVQNEPMGALSHLGLARAYALSGDSSKAKTAYRDFFALWKHADPDIPILRQAKAEWAKLK